MTDSRMAPEQVVKKLLNEKYPLASCAFLAGSIMRKEASKYSDLDIVFLYDHLDPAFRESFVFLDYPIDTFHHDYQTLKYFFEEIEKPSAYPPLIHMIIEGVVYPGSNELSEKAKAYALATIQSGPKPYTPQEIEMQRYALTSLVDDIRDYRSVEELQGTLSELYGALANFYCRAQNEWCAKDKSIPKVLKSISQEYATQYSKAFTEGFQNSKINMVVELVEQTLKPYGGFLFNDFHLEAPKDWRK